MDCVCAPPRAKRDRWIDFLNSRGKHNAQFETLISLRCFGKNVIIAKQLAVVNRILLPKGEYYAIYLRRVRALIKYLPFGVI